MNEQNLDFILELYNVPKLFQKIINHLSPDEQKRYLGQINWFVKKCQEFITNAGYSFVVPEGMYDVGIAATPLNLSDFDKDEELLIDQVIEPIVMFQGKVVKSGVVLLKSTKVPEPVVEIIEPEVEPVSDNQDSNIVETEAEIIEPTIKFVDIDFSSSETVSLGDVPEKNQNNQNNQNNKKKNKHKKHKR